MKCDVCGEEAEHYENKYIEQYFCNKCGWYVNV